MLMILPDLVLRISSSGRSSVSFIINANHKYTTFLNSVSHSGELSNLRAHGSLFVVALAEMQVAWDT